MRCLPFTTSRSRSSESRGVGFQPLVAFREQHACRESTRVRRTVERCDEVANQTPGGLVPQLAFPLDTCKRMIQTNV